MSPSAAASRLPNKKAPRKRLSFARRVFRLSGYFHGADTVSYTHLPVTGAENAANGSGEKREKKKKGLSPSFRERLGAESSNAVISLIKAAIYLVCVLIVSGGISLAAVSYTHLCGRQNFARG